MAKITVMVKVKLSFLDYLKVFRETLSSYKIRWYQYPYVVLVFFSALIKFKRSI